MPAHFGLDISSSTVKVAEARTVKDGYELEAFGEIKTPSTLLSKNPQDDIIIVKTIKQLLDESQIHSRQAYIALPNSSVYNSVIQLPLLNDQELANALKFEAEQYIPIPMDEVYLEHQILYSPPKEKTEEKMDVLIVAAKKNMVDKIIKICEMAEIIPLVVETAMLGTVRALQNQLGDNAVLVEIGDLGTSVTIIQKGIIKQSSSIPTGGKALTRAIAQSLNLPEQQAKQYKHAYGLERDLLEGKIAQALEEPIGIIVNHLSKNIRFANSLNVQDQVNQIILSGGTALLPGLTHFLVSKLNIEVNLANPLITCLNNNLPSQLISAAPRFSTVIGLAIRE